MGLEAGLMEGVPRRPSVVRRRETLLRRQTPRMHPDSGRLMTGRAATTAKVRERQQTSAQGRSLSLGPSGPHPTLLQRGTPTNRWSTTALTPLSPTVSSTNTSPVAEQHITETYRKSIKNTRLPPSVAKRINKVFCLSVCQ